MSGRRRDPVLAVLVVLLAVAGCTGAGPDRADVRRVTIVAVSDWHGQLEPITITAGGTRRPVGGAAALKAYFDRERARNPGGTVVLTAGDAFGATPPMSSFLEDVPAIEAQNAMGVDLDTLGNHNFDHGLARLEKLMGLARFRYVVANVVDAAGRTPAPPTHTVTLDGVRVGFIGLGHPDTPALVFPGHTGHWRFLDPAPVVNRYAAALRRQGAEVVVVIAHIGASAVGRDGVPVGDLADLARAVRGVDVLVGDHTDVRVNALVNGVLVVENRSKGIEYAVIDVTYDARRRRVLHTAARHEVAAADAIRPDPALAAMVDGWRAQVEPRFDGRLGEVAAAVDHHRARESALGSFVADALRAAYRADVALVNSGGLRDTLPSSYRPADRRLRRPVPGYAPGPPFDIVRGDVHALARFGNVAVTFRITGRTLRAALEHGVSEGGLVGGRYASASGRFLQVSGVRYTFDPARPPGRRVVDVVRADGTRLAPDDTPYAAVTLDFVYRGGDGFAMLDNGTGTTRDLVADVVSAALAAASPLSVRVDGRIVEVAR
jgi:5'-nucleotidase